SHRAPPFYSRSLGERDVCLFCPGPVLAAAALLRGFSAPAALSRDYTWRLRLWDWRAGCPCTLRPLLSIYSGEKERSPGCSGRRRETADRRPGPRLPETAFPPSRNPPTDRPRPRY